MFNILVVKIKFVLSMKFRLESKNYEFQTSEDHPTRT